MTCSALILAESYKSIGLFCLLHKTLNPHFLSFFWSSYSCLHYFVTMNLADFRFSLVNFYLHQEIMGIIHSSFVSVQYHDTMVLSVMFVRNNGFYFPLGNNEKPRCYAPQFFIVPSGEIKPIVSNKHY